MMPKEVNVNPDPRRRLRCFLQLINCVDPQAHMSNEFMYREFEKADAHQSRKSFFSFLHVDGLGFADNDSDEIYTYIKS